MHGTVSLAKLERLVDSLHDTKGGISYSLTGGYDGRQRPRLMLQVAGTLRLKCQRCLGLLELPLQIASTLLLVPTGDTVAAEVDDPLAPDAIEASPELDVDHLIEDEILLGLPLAPRHAESACENRVASTRPVAANASAFAEKLEAWKKL
jgi:uncharacterized protein